MLFPIIPDGNIGLSSWKKLTGHKGAVLRVAWNPHRDGILLSSSQDCTVRVREYYILTHYADARRFASLWSLVTVSATLATATISYPHYLVLHTASLVIAAATCGHHDGQPCRG